MSNSYKLKNINKASYKNKKKIKVRTIHQIQTAS